MFQVGILPYNTSKKEVEPGVTKHVYVMEPDVPGGSIQHTSLLGLAHVQWDKEVGATIVIPAQQINNILDTHVVINQKLPSIVE